MRYKSVKRGSTYSVQDTQTGKTLVYATLNRERNRAVLRFMNAHPEMEPNEAYYEGGEQYKRDEDAAFNLAVAQGRVRG